MVGSETSTFRCGSWGAPQRFSFELQQHSEPAQEQHPPSRQIRQELRRKETRMGMESIYAPHYRAPFVNRGTHVRCPRMLSFTYYPASRVARTELLGKLVRE